MTRQARKTRRLIYDAFSELLLKKSYSKITMQEIADTADVGRSTVYSHFETKEALLCSMCSDIFDGLLNHEHISPASYEDALAALLTHIKDNKKVIIGIVLSDGLDVLVRFCREYLGEAIGTALDLEYDEKAVKIPRDCVINHLVVSFIELVRWWAENKMEQSPNEIAAYYMQLTIPVLSSLSCDLMSAHRSQKRPEAD